MQFSGLVIQILNGFAEASSLFLIAAGMSIIFGVTRIVNFAHGSFFMIGAYVAVTIIETKGAAWFWPSLLLAPAAVAVLGLLLEVGLLRRIYHAPELTQLLATYAIMLIAQDVVLYLWGPLPIMGPKAPGLTGAVDVLGRKFPTYSLFLIMVGPLTLAALWAVISRTRWGRLVRAATQDRDMVAALGINQAWLFTSVFVLGTFVAALGGALQMPRQPASLDMDVQAIASAFVVVVVGGLGSLPGAFLAAIIVAQTKAICVWLGLVDIAGMQISMSKLTIVVEFIVMAIVLVLRPYGLLGQPPNLVRQSRHVVTSTILQPLSSRGLLVAGLILLGLVIVPQLRSLFPYLPILALEIMIIVIFASSLQLLMGAGGMHSFGHAAYFGLGAYASAMAARYFGLPLEAALIFGIGLALVGGAIIGWLSVRLTSTYFAMLTLAFAQIVWALFYQFEGIAGGENGITGVWPTGIFGSKTAFFYLVVTCLVAASVFLYRVLFSPFGYALRAARDSAVRSESIGMNVRRLQWLGFVLAAGVAGLAGALFVYSKGSVSPEILTTSRSVDGLVMVVLGGEHAIGGAALGATLFVWLRDTLGIDAEYWRALLGILTLALLLLMPQGLARLTLRKGAGS
ncbi:ABC transporter permease [Bradyrhizobium pachyrhizi]|uniref:ABC transporter permease n=1 Tax=Bradyrhizobium pachyrhizi TaxID=280333 RepID=UPI003D368C2E